MGCDGTGFPLSWATKVDGMVYMSGQMPSNKKLYTGNISNRLKASTCPASAKLVTA